MVSLLIENVPCLKLFRFLWRNKKHKIKRSGLYQDQDRGGIRMTDTNIMFKALKLAWIPRWIKSDKSNQCTIPNHFFQRMGGVTTIQNTSTIYQFFTRRFLIIFNELKRLYDYYHNQDIILFNNKEILIGGKPMFWNDWFNKGIISKGLIR